MAKQPGADGWQTVITLRCSACLLIRVSWLLVAFIPGLLMLATFGLERLEAGLDPDRPTEGRKDAKPAPRTVRTVDSRDVEFAGLPTRPVTPTRGNPQFPTTRQANRV